MSLDINTKKLKKNAFRVTKKKRIYSIKNKSSGGHLDAKLLLNIQEIADTYGDGTVHITTRQGFEIPGIDMKDIPEVNKKASTYYRSFRNKSRKSRRWIQCSRNKKRFSMYRK